MSEISHLNFKGFKEISEKLEYESKVSLLEEGIKVVRKLLKEDNLDEAIEIMKNSVRDYINKNNQVHNEELRNIMNNYDYRNTYYENDNFIDTNKEIQK